jgi:hypothetical protein
MHPGDALLLRTAQAFVLSGLLGMTLSAIYSYSEAFGLTPCIDGRQAWTGACVHPNQRGTACACEAAP